jgi:hypothetical protein
MKTEDNIIAGERSRGERVLRLNDAIICIVPDSLPGNCPDYHSGFKGRTFRTGKKIINCTNQKKIVAIIPVKSFAAILCNPSRESETPVFGQTAKSINYH